MTDKNMTIRKFALLVKNMRAKQTTWDKYHGAKDWREMADAEVKVDQAVRVMLDQFKAVPLFDRNSDWSYKKADPA